MSFRNTPIENLFLTFKRYTVPFATAYAIVLAVVGFMLLQVGAIGLALMIHAGFVYWCGKSIQISLDREDRARRLEMDSD